MRCTIHADEPLLLLDVKHGTPFIAIHPEFAEVVCVRLVPTDPVHQLLDLDVQQIAGRPASGSDCLDVVAIANRVNQGEQGFIAPGTLLRLRWDQPVIELEVIERIAFRERAPEPPLRLQVEVTTGTETAGRAAPPVCRAPLTACDAPGDLATTEAPPTRL